MTRGAVLVVAPEHAAEVSALRRAAYARSPDFTVVDPSMLDVGPLDEGGVVLAVRDASGDLVATMGAVLYGDAPTLRTRVGSNEAVHCVEYPACLLQRAATAATVRDAGMNCLLRWHLLGIASGWGVRHLVGSVMQGAARTRAMEEMGYRFHAEDHDWATFGFAGATRPTLTAILDLEENYERARHVLAARIAPLLAGHPFAAEVPSRATRQVIEGLRPLTGRDRAFVEALLAVLWADGEVVPVERAALFGFLAALGASPGERGALARRLAAATPARLEDVRLDELGADDRRLLYSYAVTFSLVDEHQVTSERALLDELARRLALDPVLAASLEPAATARAARFRALGVWAAEERAAP